MRVLHKIFIYLQAQDLSFAFVVAFAMLFCSSTVVQGQKAVSFLPEANPTSPRPERIQEQTENRLMPSVSFSWRDLKPAGDDGRLFFAVESPVDFSFFAIGWTVKESSPSAAIFRFRYRTKSDGGGWSNWVEMNGKVDADETPSELYWSDILFVNDSILHRSCEIEFFPDTNNVSFFRVDFVNATEKPTPGSSAENEKRDIRQLSLSQCPIPDVITRQEWCNGNSACVQPAYVQQIIEPTHVVIHHGGSPDSYTDGAAIVRSYWNYHVYSNGWDDIGYNFLIDADGNIYQGRANDDFPAVDVKGTHAGSVNGSSIGVCFLGNSDAINATPVQLNKLYELLAWWFNDRGFDPTTNDIVINQAGTSYLYLPRIIGHRDVKPNTICPGENVYQLLPEIRSSVKDAMIECSGFVPVTDLRLSNPNVSNSQLFAGEIIELTLSRHVEQITDNSTIPFHTSFWLSSDDSFNPKYDRLLKTFSDTFFVQNERTSNDLFLIPLDSATRTGNYFLFMISDYENIVYESDEMNNQVSVPIEVTGLSYDVLLSAFPLRGGSVSGMGNYGYGEECSVKADPFFGYSFQNWSEDGKVVSTDAEYTFIVTHPIDLIANYVCASQLPDIFIDGPTAVCAGSDSIVFSIPNVQNALSYDWSLPSGVQGSSNTNQISTRFLQNAVSGAVIVRFDNECFGDISKSIEVRVDEKPQAPDISLLNGVFISDVAGVNHWFCDDNFIDSTNDKYFAPTYKGTYYAISIEGNCSSDRSNTLYFSPNLLPGDSMNYFTLFPNPTLNLVNLFFAENTDQRASIEIFDVAGNMLFSKRYPVGIRVQTIDMNSFSRGLYIIRVTIGNKAFSKKIEKL